MEKTDILIVGAGVVGLAVAVELSNRFENYTVVVVERHGKFGQEISSRNSEVIHAGIYYPKDSLKAKLCVEGNRLIYNFCRDWDIQYQRLGKLIVARDLDEIPALEAIMAQGRENGVTDLEFLDTKQVAQIEPFIRAVAAVYSPSTGIIDSHGFMKRLEWLAVNKGAMMAYRHEVVEVEASGHGYRVIFQGPDGKLESVLCHWLINCTGLSSDRVASMPGLNIDKAGYRIYPCKGEYFCVSNKKAGLISHLVYPPPLEGLKGLGIHVTKSIDGRIRLGPNAFYVNDVDYDVNLEHAAEFYESAKSYLPFLDFSDIQPDMSGIRPKLQPLDGSFRDFIVCHEAERGFEGIINLLGIESPGLTSSLSLARMVCNIVQGK